jgi:hypothetical protein
MAMSYKKRKLSVALPLELYEEIKKAAVKMDWTEEEILGWAVAFGVDGIDNIDEMEKELSELVGRKNKLDSELEGITLDYGKLSSRNAALRYEYFDTFTGNRTLAIRLTGAKAINRSFKNILKIADDGNEQEDRTDSEMAEKYIFR